MGILNSRWALFRIFSRNASTIHCILNRMELVRSLGSFRFIAGLGNILASSYLHHNSNNMVLVLPGRAVSPRLLSLPSEITLAVSSFLISDLGMLTISRWQNSMSRNFCRYPVAQVFSCHLRTNYICSQNLHSEFNREIVVINVPSLLEQKWTEKKKKILYWHVKILLFTWKACKLLEIIFTKYLIIIIDIYLSLHI